MLRISEQESNIQQLTKENADLKNKTAEVKTQAIAEAENTNRSATPEIIKMIEEKLNSGFSSITENINQMIESKLNNMTAPSTSKPHSATETNGDIASYSAILRGNGNNGGKAKDFRTIMLETKNEELAEEAERKRRVKNLIMFNKSEVTPEHDKDFIQNLIKELKVGDINVKQIERIGERSSLDLSKKRPIKIVFNNEEDKEKVMANLRNLKDIEMFKGISIAQDHTYSERMLIKEYHQRAKSKNEQEGEDPSFVWRVRGTPKNGLSLKKIYKEKIGNTNH